MASCDLSAWNHNPPVLKSRAARRRFRLRRTAILHSQRNTWDLYSAVPFMHSYGQGPDVQYNAPSQTDAVLSYLSADAQPFCPEFVKTDLSCDIETARQGDDGKTLQDEEEVFKLNCYGCWEAIPFSVFCQSLHLCQSCFQAAQPGAAKSQQQNDVRTAGCDVSYTDPECSKATSFKRTVATEQHPESADWEFLQRSLQPCIAALRCQFDSNRYSIYMEQQKSLNDIVAARTQAISSVVDDFVLVLTDGMNSERAQNQIKQHEFRIRRLLKQEVHEVFTSIEKASENSRTTPRVECVYAEPKIPPSAYFLFISRAKMRWDGESDSLQLFARMASTEWKTMSAEDRKEYEVEAMRRKAAHAEQLSDYKEFGYYRISIT